MTNEIRPAYKLRLATVRDLADVYDFYHAHQHNNVNIRQRDMYADAIRRGTVTLLLAPDGAICGSSIAWQHDGNAFAEIGSTRVIGPKGGYPIGEIMAASQSLNAFLYAPPGEHVVAEVDRSNKPTQDKLTGPLLRFLPWQPSGAFVKSKKDQTVRTSADDKDYFQCRVEMLPTHARYVLQTLADGTLTGKGGGAIAIDLSELPIIARDLGKIRAIAASDWGDPAAPDASRGMRDWRDRFFAAYAPPPAGPRPNHPAPGPAPRP